MKGSRQLDVKCVGKLAQIKQDWLNNKLQFMKEKKHLDVTFEKSIMMICKVFDCSCFKKSQRIDIFRYFVGSWRKKAFKCKVCDYRCFKQSKKANRFYSWTQNPYLNTVKLKLTLDYCFCSYMMYTYYTETPLGFQIWVGNQ